LIIVQIMHDITVVNDQLNAQLFIL